jgi:hypothetical protein
MNRLDIRAAARTITELEVSDVSDALIDSFARDGYERMIAMERRWPFFETSTTLSTVADQREYSVSTIGDGNWREVSSIFCMSPPRKLTYTSPEDAEEAHLGVTERTGTPQWYSLWAGKVSIWPKPTEVYSLQLRGYRKPNDWHTTDAAEVDADLRLHRPLINFVVAELFKMQEDPEMSAFHRQAYEEGVRLGLKDVMRASSETPLVLSGGRPWRGDNPMSRSSFWS